MIGYIKYGTFIDILNIYIHNFIYLLKEQNFDIFRIMDRDGNNYIK